MGMEAKGVTNAITTRAKPGMTHNTVHAGYLVLHLRMEKIQASDGLKDGTLLPKVVKMMQNFQKATGGVSAGVCPE